jgi:hypothetical protein
MPASTKKSSSSIKPEEETFDISKLKFPISMEGIYKMYTYLFKELGWMVLAKERKDTDTCKIKSYVEEISRLMASIDEKQKTIKDTDEINNLEILKYNLHTLMDHVKKEFDVKQSGGSKKKQQKKISRRSLKNRK